MRVRMYMYMYMCVCVSVYLYVCAQLCSLALGAGYRTARTLNPKTPKP